MQELPLFWYTFIGEHCDEIILEPTPETRTVVGDGSTKPGNYKNMTGSISRRKFMKTTAKGLPWILLSGCAPAILSGKSKYNVLLITIDTLRADHLGCYGYRRNTSPAIDEFARRNILFKNFYAVAPITGPSTASLLTGRYIQNHGVTYNWLKRDLGIKAFPELIPDSYRKAGFSANAVLNKARGYSRGFQVFADMEHPTMYSETRTQKIITARGLGWLDALRDDENFILWLHYIDPHAPYLPPEEFDIFRGDAFYDETRTAPINGKNIENVHEIIEGNTGNLVFGAIPRCHTRDHGGIDRVDYYIAKYDAEIGHSDAEVSKILKYLNTRAFRDNTIIVLSADHGESLIENNYYFSHAMLVNEGNIHIPLIMSHPEVKRPLVIESLLQNTDVAPTILSELGLIFPGHIDGVDFSRLYRAPSLRRGSVVDEEVRPFVYSCTSYEYGHFYETIRTLKGKLVGKCDISREKKIPDDLHSIVTTILFDTEDFSFYDVSNGKLDTEDNKREMTQEEKQRYMDSLGIMRKILSGHVSAADLELTEKDREALRALGYMK
jgi:arylsulfatase